MPSQFKANLWSLKAFDLPFGPKNFRRFWPFRIAAKSRAVLYGRLSYHQGSSRFSRTILQTPHYEDRLLYLGRYFVNKSLLIRWTRKSDSHDHVVPNSRNDLKSKVKVFWYQRPWLGFHRSCWARHYKVHHRLIQWQCVRILSWFLLKLWRGMFSSRIRLSYY